MPTINSVRGVANVGKVVVATIQLRGIPDTGEEMGKQYSYYQQYSFYLYHSSFKAYLYDLIRS